MNELYRGFVRASIEQMLAETAAAASYDNQVLKGLAREIFVVNLLRPYLSPRFGICSGIVVDSHDQRSRQVDVIVFDRSITPAFMVRDTDGVVPIESVLLTVEVKSRLGRSELVDAIHNARSLKFLDPQYEELRPASPQKNSVACAVFALKSDLESKAELARLEECVAESNAEERTIHVPVSGLCVAGRSFSVCVNAGDRPASFRDYRASGEHDEILHFVRFVVNVANEFSLQRQPITFGRYLF